MLPALQRGQSHTSLWFASEASQRVHAPFAFPSRSLAMAGDKTKKQAAYNDILTLWKNADSDLPILRQTKAEFARFQ